MTEHESREALRKVLASHRPTLIRDWIERLRTSDGVVTGRIREGELRSQAETVLAGMEASLAGGDAGQAAFLSLEETLTEVARERALQGFTPTDTAMFVFSLKEPIFDALSAAYEDDPKAIAAGIWDTTVLVDRLGLHTMRALAAAASGPPCSQVTRFLATSMTSLLAGGTSLP